LYDLFCVQCDKRLCISDKLIELFHSLFKCLSFLFLALILVCIGIDEHKLRSIQCEGVEVSIEDIRVFFNYLVLGSSFALISQFNGAFVIFELGKAEQTIIKERWSEDCDQ